MVDGDCAHHMLVTTPLSSFVDSPVKKYKERATGKSTCTIYKCVQYGGDIKSIAWAYCECLQGAVRELLIGNGFLRFQQRSNPGVAYLRLRRWCDLLLDGVGLQIARKSCCRRQYTTHPWHTNGGYQNMVRRVGDCSASPDVHADDVRLRLNLALSEKADSRLVSGQRNHHVVVQEKVQVPHEGNGYHSLVPTVDVAMILQDKMDQDKMNELGKHQPISAQKMEPVYRCGSWDGHYGC